MMNTQKACRLVGVDRQRLNHAIAAGHYTVAPQGTGRNQIWAREDFLALWVFSEMLQMGFKSEGASRDVDQLLELIRRDPEASWAVLACFDGERQAWVTMEELDAAPEKAVMGINFNLDIPRTIWAKATQSRQS